MRQAAKHSIIIALAVLSGISCTNFVELDAPKDPPVDYSTSGSSYGHDFVDLGLSVMWATCNVGASKPEDYGYYFAWGEVDPKADYSWETYKYGSSSRSFTKYNTVSAYGTVDNKMTLELSDDAARINWGETWRMPTGSEQEELRNNCAWLWTTLNGVKGYKVTSKINGNSIFLPAAGERNSSSLLSAEKCYIWSSSLSTDSPHLAYNLGVTSYGTGWELSNHRFRGCVVRPVFKDSGTR